MEGKSYPFESGYVLGFIGAGLKTSINEMMMLGMPFPGAKPALSAGKHTPFTAIFFIVVTT